MEIIYFLTVVFIIIISFYTRMLDTRNNNNYKDVIVKRIAFLMDYPKEWDNGQTLVIMLLKGQTRLAPGKYILHTHALPHSLCVRMVKVGRKRRSKIVWLPLLLFPTLSLVLLFFFFSAVGDLFPDPKKPTATTRTAWEREGEEGVNYECNGVKNVYIKIFSIPHSYLILLSSCHYYYYVHVITDLQRGERFLKNAP